MTSVNGSLQVGLVHNWPGARNSELDIILRILPVLEQLGHTGIVIDPMGQELTREGDRVIPAVKHDDFDLVLSLHYLNPKLLSGLSYAVNWNPLAYLVDDPVTRQPLPIRQLAYIADCFRSHDRILSAGSRQVDAFVDTLRADNPASWLATAQLSLHTSIATPEDSTEITVTAENARVFFIGANWEKLSGKKQRVIRHDGLLETLDKSGEFVFYGLREEYGVSLWDGISHYRGELPFDSGQSILEESRNCGMTLVLSSPQHRDSALVSTRIFQACAAGTVIISDRNKFIETHFGDNVYYFDYSDTPRGTAENLIALVEHIKQDWPTALKKARTCHELFRAKFALEKEVASLCLQAQQDLSARADFIDAVRDAIHVVVDCRSYGPQAAEQALRYCASQRLRPECVHLIVDGHQGLDEPGKLTTQLAVKVHDTRQPLGRFLVDRGSQLGDAFIVFTPELRWNPDHLLQLFSVSQQTDSPAYAPHFTHYETLATAAEPFEYGMKGLDGSVSRIDGSALSRFCAHRFASGNILIPARLLRSLSHAHQRISQFGIGAVFVVLYELHRTTGTLPRLAPAVTSAWRSPPDHDGEAFNQYEILKARADLYRDRNMFSALYMNSNSQMQELLKSWEQQQADEAIGDDPFADYELFSKNFSAYLYLKHLFRNRPLILKGVRGTHRFLSRLLRI